MRGEMITFKSGETLEPKKTIPFRAICHVFLAENLEYFLILFLCVCVCFNYYYYFFSISKLSV